MTDVDSMKYRIFFIFGVLLLALDCVAAAPGLTAEKCFTEAPESVIPLLDESTRLDMLDYFHAGSQKPSINAAEGQALVKGQSDYSLSFQISEGINAQIFVLNPEAKCPTIGYIETVSLPVADSSLRFFNCRWEPVDVQAMPGLADWVKSGRKADLQQLKEVLPFLLVTAEYDPDKSTLVLTNNTEQYFAKTDRPTVLSSLRQEMKLQWTGKKFKK